MAEITAELVADRRAILEENLTRVRGLKAEAAARLEELTVRESRLAGQIAETDFWAKALEAEAVTREPGGGT